MLLLVDFCLGSRYSFPVFDASKVKNILKLNFKTASVLMDSTSFHV
jgi:hypothetical protein